MNEQISRMILSQDFKSLIEGGKEIRIFEKREEILEIAMVYCNSNLLEVAYDVDGKGKFVEATQIRRYLLEVDRQHEVGSEGFKKGSIILSDFFEDEASKFSTPDLDPLGRGVVEGCLNDVSIEDYINLISMYS